MVVRDIMNLAGPPKAVPVLVRLRVLFGGFINQFGWFFFGFGLIFVWLFTLHADLTSWYHFRGDIRTVEGNVLYNDKTGMSEGGSKHSDGTPIYATHYAFTTTDNVKYEGISYATGRFHNKGETVTIEYPSGKPKISRIRGMGRKHVGLFGLMPVPLPLIGSCLIIAGLKKGVKANRLLTRGELTTGRLKSKVRTKTQVNDQYVYKLTFEFNTADGATAEAVAKTHNTEVLENETEEPLLYDPLLPSYAIMLDDLPGSPRIDQGGNIKTATPAAAFLSLILPAVTIIGHGTYIWLNFLR